MISLCSSSNTERRHSSIILDYSCCYCSLHKVAAVVACLFFIFCHWWCEKSCPQSGTTFSHFSSDVVLSVVVVVAAVVGLGLRLSDCNHAQLDYRSGYREDSELIQANSVSGLDIIPWNIQTDEHVFWFCSLMTVLVDRGNFLYSLNVLESKFWTVLQYSEKALPIVLSKSYNCISWVITRSLRQALDCS